MPGANHLQPPCEKVRPSGVRLSQLDPLVDSRQPKRNLLGGNPASADSVSSLILRDSNSSFVSSFETLNCEYQYSASGSRLAISGVSKSIARLVSPCSSIRYCMSASLNANFIDQLPMRANALPIRSCTAALWMVSGLGSKLFFCGLLRGILRFFHCIAIPIALKCVSTCFLNLTYKAHVHSGPGA